MAVVSPSQSEATGAGSDRRYAADQRILEPGEEIQHQARAGNAAIALTDRRLAVVDADRSALAVEIAQVRRLQFDIEKQRPAVLVIVPEHPADVPQGLSVPPDAHESVATVLVELGRRLAPLP